MRSHLWKRSLAVLLALILCLSVLPPSAFAANPVLTVTPAPGFTVYPFTGPTTDAQNGTKITDNTIDLSQSVYFMTGNDVQMSGLCLWPVEGDELPPQTICNSAYNGKVYSDDLLVLKNIGSSSLMAGTILGSDVGYDWDTGKFYANKGTQLQYMAAGDYYPEPGRYRFLMFYSSYCYYSEVYTITDSTNLTANQGVLEATWLADGNVTNVVPYDTDAQQASFDLSLSFPASVQGIHSVRLLKADYDIFGSDSYYWFGTNAPNSSFQVGEQVDEGVHGGKHIFTLKNCTVKNMSTGCYRVKVISSDNMHYIDNTVTVVKEVSAATPTITTVSLPNGKAEKTYYAKLEATPAEGGAITWSVASGTLPDGLTLAAATGELSGTPTMDGSFTFFVRASESGAGYAEKEYTIEIAQADLFVQGEPGFWFSSVEDEIASGSAFSIYLNTNRQPNAGETGAATLHYTSTAGAEKTVRYALDMSMWYGGYYNGTLPTDAQRIDSVVFELNGETVLTQPVGRNVAPVLKLSFSGTTSNSLYLCVDNKEGKQVYSRNLYTKLDPLEITSLPAGTYTLRLQGYVNQFGSMRFGEATVTLKNGETTSLTLPVTNHEGIYVQVSGALEGETWCGYSRFEWYADAAGTRLLQAGEGRWLLDNEAVWVRAIPQYYDTVTNDPSELIRIDRTSGTGNETYRSVTITMPKKPSATVRLRVQTEQLAGGWANGNYEGHYTRYGAGGQSLGAHISHRDARDGVLTLPELTAGTRISVTGDTGWGSAEYIVTAADVAAGTVDKTLQIPLADGVFRYNLTYTDSWRALQPRSRDYVSGIELRKADGTVLPTVLRNEFLVLTDPSLVSVGETLTLVSWWGEKDFPVAYGETQLTVTSDNGRKTGTARVDLVQRPQFFIYLDRGPEVPAVSELIFGADGKLVWMNRTACAADGGQFRTINSPRLPAGAYFIGLAARDYLDSITPGEYDTAAEFAALPFAVMQAGVLTGFDYVWADQMTVPGGLYDLQKVNLSLSGVRMSKTYNELARLDLTLTPKPGFSYNESRGVELYIITNQSGVQGTWGGFVSTKSLQVNGKTVDLNRWHANGVIQSDGTITLKLTQAELQELGGLPLTMSTTFELAESQQLEAKAYFRYYVGNELHSDYIGECSEATGDLTLTVPNMITDGSFTVYGRGPATVSAGDPYVVTIYLDGKPIASGFTDTSKGYYRIQLNLSEDELRPLQTLHFTASGAYAGGVKAYSSEQQNTLYNPEGAQLQTFTLSWESHAGDFEAGRGQSIVILNDGDAPNLYGSWYRGANNGWGSGKNDLAKIFWHVTFSGHPEKVLGARVYVPRNGETVTLECTKLEDGSWVSEPTYFSGVAPDGAWVEFDCPVEYGYVNEPESAVTAADVANFLSLLGGNENVTEIEGSPLNGDILMFLLADEKGDQLPVGFSLMKMSWNETEMSELRALELDPKVPNLLSYEEGWRTFGEGADAFTVWCSDTVSRFVNHDDNTKHIYTEELYTPDFRIVTTWDESTKTKQMSVLTIGALGYHDFDLGEIADEGLRDIIRAAELQDIWTIFYQELADAIVDAVEAADPDAQTNGTSRISAISVTPVEATRGPSYKEITEAMKRLDSIKEKIEKKLDDPFTKIVQDSFDWCHGKEIKDYEIRSIKNFLDDNPCLKRLYKFYRTATNDANNPYRIIAEADSVYYKIGMGELGKIVENAFNAGSYLQGGVKEAAEKLGDAMYKGTVETAYDMWYQKMWEADLFESQASNLAHEIYLAARRAEREERGVGGLCSEGIDWSRFPTYLYDYSKYFGYGPRSYMYVKPPAGPQGRYDPSGYIYEAVPSNRLEGAEVTLWQLDGSYETTLDESGVVATLTGGYAYLIDAEAFGLEPNPQITGADGRYQWFVPEGWWRVQVTKAGYKAADTGLSGDYGVNARQNAADGYWYMPVLPEQLDVNIPLVSYDAPVVEALTANTRGVFVRFSKYMDETTLTEARFGLYVNGEKAEFTLDLADSEKSDAAADAPSYTRTAWLRYEGMAEGDSVQLVIDNRVTSYAGVAMEERYDSGVQTVTAPEQAKAPTVMPASGEIAADTVLQIACDTENAVLHYTLDGSEPTEDSPVLTAQLVVNEDMTLKLLATRYDLLPSAVTTRVYTIAREITPPARVVATVNGEVVHDGDTVKPGKLVLTCATEGAEIWYTTNGVCPCDDETARTRYTAPIDLTPGTYFFRIRALKDGVYSEGLPLHLTVEASDAHEHEWNTPTYVWASDNSAVTAQRVCKLDASHVETETVRTSSEVTKEATYAAEGEITYTAVFTNAAFEAQTKRVATPKLEPQVLSNPFADVKEGAYYYDAVLWAVNAKPQVTSGTSATTFSPNATCTRAQVVTFLWRAKGCPEPSVTQNPFKDVASSEYYYKAVLWAVENEITTGTSATTFSPNAGCTRAQVVTFLWRAEGKPQPASAGDPFRDVASGAYYYSAVLWAVGKDITNGTSATTFSPNATCTRGQIVTFLHRDMAK